MELIMLSPSVVAGGLMNLYVKHISSAQHRVDVLVAIRIKILQMFVTGRRKRWEMPAIQRIE